MRRRTVLAGLLAPFLPIPNLPIKRVLKGTWTVVVQPMEILYHPDAFDDMIASAIAKEIARELDTDIINSLTHINDSALLHI